jgi:hypothetical protein
MVHMEGGSSGEEAAAGPLENMNVTLDSPEKASVVEERRGEAGGWNGSQRNEGNHRLRHTHQKFNRGNVPQSSHVATSSALLERGLPHSPLVLALLSYSVLRIIQETCPTLRLARVSRVTRASTSLPNLLKANSSSHHSLTLTPTCPCNHARCAAAAAAYPYLLMIFFLLSLAVSHPLLRILALM